MSLESLLDSLPAYADDVKRNWRMAVSQAELTPLQIWGTAVASAVSARNRILLDAVTAEASLQIAPQMLDAARSAAAVMSASNIYFRFVHYVNNENYSKIPAHLRSNASRSHSAPPADFELWSIAVSAINCCEVCIQSHEAAARDKGLSVEAILAAVRIASVIHAAAVMLEAA